MLERFFESFHRLGGSPEQHTLQPTGGFLFTDKTGLCPLFFDLEF
jgi:hypothetical protein